MARRRGKEGAKQMRTDFEAIGEVETDVAKKRNISVRLLAAALLLLLVGGGVFFATKRHYENKTTVEYVQVPVEREKIVEVPVETKTVITGEIMQEKLRDIGELVTEEYTYTEVGTYDSSKSVQLFGYGVDIPLTQSKFIYSYDGTIKAGIDFTRITVEKNEETRQVTVTLPKAVILSSELDEDSFELYDERNNIFNPFSVSDVNATNRTLKTSAEQKAVAKGLLTRADANAKALVLGFLKSTYDLDGYTFLVETARS